MSTAMKSPPRATGSTATRKMSLSDVTTKGKGLPSRMVIHGVEGIGKTSFPANSPNPIYLQARGETGLETLIDSGRLSEVPHLPEIQTFNELLEAIDMLCREDHGYQTIVLDTINGFERLCHEHVCRKHFNNDWTDKGFMGYGRGFETSLADWRELLIALDRLRETKSMAVVALCHTKVTTFKNPEGPDYDRYAPDMHAKTWGLTHKWADIVLFANYETFTEKDGLRHKAASGEQVRFLYSERRAAFDAKNRHGLPFEISMGSSGKEAWSNFISAIKAGRQVQN